MSPEATVALEERVVMLEQRLSDQYERIAELQNGMAYRPRGMTA